MAKKQQAMTNKLGSWTDQAQLTRNQPAPEPAPATPVTNSRETSTRETYAVPQSLIDRIASTAVQHGVTQNELVGHLLTWALNQVDAGAHQIQK